MVRPSDPRARDTELMGSSSLNLDDLAQLVVRRAVAVTGADRVVILAREESAIALVMACAAEVANLGATPQILFTAADIEQRFLRFGEESAIAEPNPIEMQALEWATVCIAIRGSGPAHAGPGISDDRLLRFRGAQGAVSALRAASTRWIIVRLPDEEMSAVSGLSLPELHSVFLDASVRDWDADGLKWSATLKYLNQAKEIRIVGPAVDLRFSTVNRRWLFGDGKINLPDGELYTAPLDGSLSGWVDVSWPSHFGGVRIAGLRLEFQKGVVSNLTAQEGEAFARSLIAIDEGASCVGEIGFGTNPAIQRPVGDLFFDEKILGSMHLALGRAYAECGGSNSSMLHWDIVHDIRDETTVSADGVVMFANGGWLTTAD